MREKTKEREEEEEASALQDVRVGLKANEFGGSDEDEIEQTKRSDDVPSGKAESLKFGEDTDGYNADNDEDDDDDDDDDFASKGTEEETTTMTGEVDPLPSNLEARRRLKQVEMFVTPTARFDDRHRRGIEDLKTLLAAERAEEKRKEKEERSKERQRKREEVEAKRSAFLHEFVEAIPTKKRREINAKKKLAELVERDKSNDDDMKTNRKMKCIGVALAIIVVVGG